MYDKHSEISNLQATCQEKIQYFVHSDDKLTIYGVPNKQNKGKWWNRFDRIRKAILSKQIGH
jgi:hypothetical protein